MAYNFDRTRLHDDVARIVDTYEQARAAQDPRFGDRTTISWTAGLRALLARNQTVHLDEEAIRPALYRPFQRSWAYVQSDLNERAGLAVHEFSTGQPNVGIVLPGVSSHSAPCALMIDTLPDMHLLDTGQVFTRWHYEKAADEGGTLDFDVVGGGVVDGIRMIDNITDHSLAVFRQLYGHKIAKDDIFHYVYAMLHSPEYRETYADDLKRVLPRVPLVANARPFIEAGLALAEIHLGYESADRYPLGNLYPEAIGDPYEFFRVDKMAFPKVRVDGKSVLDKTKITYNRRIELSGVPLEAQRYMLGARSAIEWIIDRFQVKQDKASGIVNDPNDWSREVGDPRYILDLLARIVTVSVETMKIVDDLPPLKIRK